MLLSEFVKSGKLNMIIDGQFGSTGKGLIASRLALENNLDIAIASISPNAGHTFYDRYGTKFITRQFPVAGLINEGTLIYITSGSVIDLKVFQEEKEKFNIDSKRIIIHPRVPVISSFDVDNERDLSRIASTGSGSGSVRARKVLRKALLAEEHGILKEFVCPYFSLSERLIDGRLALLESSQGIDLGLNFGLSYPYCSSRDYLPANFLADCGLHPHFLGNVCLSFRTYPIRVGDMKVDNEEYTSGPVYDDSQELTWQELRQTPELSTVTKRQRRVFTFSKFQYMRSCQLAKPDLIFLNFANYVRKEDLHLFDFAFDSVKLPVPSYLGIGPEPRDIIEYDPLVLQKFAKKNSPTIRQRFSKIKSYFSK